MLRILRSYSMQRQILPKNVVPKHYRVFLSPNLVTSSYTGTVSIDLDVVEPTSSVTLNVNELQLKTVSLGAQNPTKIETDVQLQTAKFSFSEALSPGDKATLDIAFDGILNDKMCGFYRSVHRDADGEHVMATTQMEATDCRRAFPCFDEPALKATFDISIKALKKFTVLSNNAVIKTEDEGEFQVTHFDTTPRMSTYLVAFIVGELDYVESNLFRVPVRVYATPGMEKRCQFSCDLAARTLKFFEDTFGVAYPLPKLDMVGIHDFSAGAMENWGLVTYRLAVLFYEEGVDSAATKTRVAEVVQHELAHQWFGNLVTMEWWDALWLNEGFATWMSWYSSNHFFPEWNVWETYLNEAYLGCLSLDGLRSSHPIQVPVRSADDVAQIFDKISYLKGSSVIRMVAEFLGEDVFIAGIASYLKKHAYSNCATSDLWDALSEASGKDVRAFMDAWVLQAGYPMITVKGINSEGVATIEQQRYLETEDCAPEENLLYPAALAVRRADGTVGRDEVLKTRSGEVNVGTGLFKLNADQTGIYRVSYPAEIFDKLVAAGSKNEFLTVADKIGLIGDTKAVTNKSGATKLLELLDAWKNDKEPNVLTTALSALLSTGSKLVFYPEVAKKFKKFEQRLLLAFSNNLTADDDVRVAKLKADIYTSAVLCGVQSYVDSALAAFRKDKFLVDPDVREAIYIAVAANGTPEEWDELLNYYLEGTHGASGNSALRSLGATKSTEQRKKLLGLIITGEIRPQDAYHALATTGTSAEGINDSWNWLSENWFKLREIFPSSISIMNFIVEMIISKFTKLEQLDTVKKFFSDKDISGINMVLDQCFERVSINAAWSANIDSVSSWLDEYESKQ